MRARECQVRTIPPRRRAGTRTASVGGTSWDDPLMGLASDLGHKFEVGVVMEHHQVMCFCCRGDQRVNEGESPVLTPGCERSLNF